MRTSGAVTVVFSLVFLFLFSFILSFFEMTSYTARLSFHASAARLATENYFAAYLEPMYSQYHIFGREVPEGEEAVSWTEEMISEDVSYMTEKQEGEKSLLLRGGAEYGVDEVRVLTDNGLEGFYTQALTATKYRGILEAAELMKEFAGMPKQAEAHLEVAAAKAATDTAYGKVDGKILYLMTLVDGVDTKKYEKFLGGRTGGFQKETYVKFFCPDPENASCYFDRTEVYQAFLNHHENPCKTLNTLYETVAELVEQVEEREEREKECRSRLTEITGLLSAASEQIGGLQEALSRVQEEQHSVAEALWHLRVNSEAADVTATVLESRAKELDEAQKALGVQLQQAEKDVRDLEEQKKVWEKEEKRLEKLKRKQEKEIEAVKKEEEAFVKRCKEIREVCEEGYEYTKEIQSELSEAQRVKSTCESVIHSLETVLGSDVCKEYLEDLEEYLFYESSEGYDFEQIRQTLQGNKSRLRNVDVRINGTTSGALKKALQHLKWEREVLQGYSFEGLRLDYGEMSLEEDVYTDVADLVSETLAGGFLGFLTEKEISAKVLDTSYLPSGFCYKDKSHEFPSVPGVNVSGVLSGLKAFLPDGVTLEEAASKVVEEWLFHSYLVGHFEHFVEGNGDGALSYELEYLIRGEDTDSENLSSVVAQICGIRMILHFISIYTDSAKKVSAEQAALAVCGMIGLPALKSVITLLLVLIWALEEAIVDTTALLLGKRLSLYPGKTGGSISFPEILLFSKSFVREKAGGKSGGEKALFGYGEYLQAFLLLKTEESKRYRSLDLIQENLRKWYTPSFRVNRCVWEIGYRTDKRVYEYRYE